MHLKSTLFVVFVLAFSFQAKSQGLHFTQFQFAPLTVNPALAGAYYGSFRIGGIYRDQYRSVATKPYTTMNFMADAPIIRGFRKQDWIGIGLGTTVLDQAGSLGYKNTHFRLGGTYHFSLDKKQTSIFSIGIQLNSSNVSINNLTTNDTRGGNATGDLDVNTFNSGSNQGEISDGYSDYVLGVMYNSRGKETDLKFGLSAARVLSPELRLGELEKLDLRLMLFGVYTMQMNDKTSFAPAVLVQLQGAAREIVAQGQFGYKMKPDLQLNAGLGYRLGDAIQILLGAQVKDIRVGLSYDMNISSLSAASNTVGGFELGVSYMGKIFKKPSIKPIIVCPSL